MCKEHHHCHHQAQECDCCHHQAQERDRCHHQAQGCNCCHHQAQGCDCCHHEHGNARLPLRIGAAALLFAAAVSGLLPTAAGTALFVAAWFVAGADIVYAAGRNILRGKWLDENALMTIATLGAVFLGEYPEAAMVMILFQSGEYLQHKAVESSKRSIAELMDIRPDYACREENGTAVRRRPEEIAVGDVIIVKSGEKIPLDGLVTDGEATVDTSALTGESLPRRLVPGSEALSGFINTNGLLKIKVSKPFGESTAAKILELVEHADARKARTEKFITRFARFYTPAVVAAAILLALVPPLVVPGTAFAEWLQRALTFLVISCPCALVISVPLTFFAGIGGASRNGILIKGSNYLETLANCKTAVFDKTGTLTRGVFEVSRILPAAGIGEDRLLKTAAAAESASNHPIALSIRKAAGEKETGLPGGQAEEIAGCGVRIKKDGKEILAGNLKLMEKFKISGIKEADGGTVAYIAEDGKYLGALVISDTIKETAAGAVAELGKLGIRTVMLTGDNEPAAAAAAGQLGINRFYAGLLPGEKVKKLEELIKAHSGGSVIFVGDGINDAPVLTRADAGIAMGTMGSDAAIEAADAVIMNDDPQKVAEAVKIARKTMGIVRQNIVFALGVKALFLALGAAGMMTMWGAVFADVGVTMLAVLNALRALKKPR